MLEIILIGLGLAFWLVLCWIVGSVAEKRGHEGWTAMLVAFLFSPIIGFLYVLCLPDKSGEAKAGGGERTPTGRIRAVGPDMETWTQARAEGKLCHACNAILRITLQPGEKCPECYARRK